MPFFEIDTEPYEGKGKARAKESDVIDFTQENSPNVQQESRFTAQQERHASSSSGTQSSALSSSSGDSQAGAPSSSQTETDLDAQPVNEMHIFMSTYNQWFKKRGIDMNDIISPQDDPNVLKRRHYLAQQGKIKYRKLGVGLSRRPVQSKKEKENQQYKEEAERQREEILSGPNRHVYAPHLDIMYEITDLSDDDEEYD